MIDDYLDYAQWCVHYGFHETLDLVSDGEITVRGSGPNKHIAHMPHEVVEELIQMLSRHAEK